MAAKTRTLTSIDLPIVSPGTQRHLSVVRYGPAGGRPKAYLHAGLHADEIPGMLVLNHLMRMLNASDDRGEIIGEVIVLPVANPIGSSQVMMDQLLGRHDMASGVNFNRRYPQMIDAIAQRCKDHLRFDADYNVRIVQGAIRAVLAELNPVSDTDFWRTSLLRLCGDADIVLDLHCDSQAVLHVYMGSTLWPFAKDLGRQIGAQSTLLADKSGGEPFDEAISGIYWDLAERFPQHPIPPGCLAATIELRGQADVSDEIAARDADNLFRFLQRRGVIAGNPGELPTAIGDATRLEAVDIVRAPIAGVVNYLRHPGDYVRKNDKIATIIDPLSTHGPTASNDVLAGTTGLLVARRSDRMTRPGQALCKIAGADPLPWRDRDNLLTD